MHSGIGVDLPRRGARDGLAAATRPRAAWHPPAGDRCCSCSSSCRARSATSSTSTTSRRCSSASTSPAPTAVWSATLDAPTSACTSTHRAGRPTRLTGATHRCLHRPEPRGEAGAVPSPFRFDRAWHFGVTPEELWATLSHTDRYREWWPWLREFDRRRTVVTTLTHRRGRARGDPGAVAVPAALRRAGRRRGARPSASSPPSTATSSGPARLELAPVADGTEARLAWELELRAPLLRTLVDHRPPGDGVGARPHRRAGARAVRGARAPRATASALWLTAVEAGSGGRGRGARRDFMRLATLPTFSTCFTRRSRACSAADFRFCSCSMRQCLNTTGTRIWSWCDGEVVDAGVGDRRARAS